MEITVDENPPLINGETGQVYTLNPTGPTSSLDINPYKFDSLQYPTDLSSNDSNTTRKPHVVKFYINVPENSQYLSGQSGVQLTPVDPGVNEPALNQTRNLFGVQLTPLMKRISTQISLYIPDSMNMSFQLGYDSTDLKDYAVPFFGQLGASAYEEITKAAKGESSLQNFISGMTKITAAAVGQSRFSTLIPSDVLAKGQGVALNPQVQLLFKSVSLRTFQMDFMFSPKSQQESNDINSIIQTFKFHAAPEVGGGVTDTTGLFFVVPSTFNLQFLFQNRENPYLQKIGECVLESVDVDYAPNGWSSFHDGSPTQIKMSLQFKETEIVDKSKVLQGY